MERKLPTKSRSRTDRVIEKMWALDTSSGPTEGRFYALAFFLVIAHRLCIEPCEMSWRCKTPMKIPISHQLHILSIE